MAKKSLRDRFEAIDDKADVSEEEEIWSNLRLMLVPSRISIVILTVLVSEVFEERFVAGLTLALWAPIVGIPLFFLVTALISVGDRAYRNQETVMEKADKRVKETVIEAH